MVDAPIHPSSLVLHFDYTAWADQRLIEACRELPPEALSRDHGASHSSILDTLRHIYYADRIWLSRLEGAPRSFKDSTEPAFEELSEQWPKLLARFRSFMANLSADSLTGNLEFQNLAGKPCSLPRWQVCLHVVNHGTLHRGQVMSMMRQAGYTPPPTDLIFFYLSLGR